jgi:hypothetical protein
MMCFVHFPTRAFGLKAVLRQIPMAVTLICCVLVCFVWVRSYMTGDSYQWLSFRQDGEVAVVKGGTITTGQGGLGVFMWHTTTSDLADVERYKSRMDATGQTRQLGYRTSPSPRYPTRWTPDDGPMSALGFFGRNFVTDTPDSHRWRLAVTVPFWALFVLAAGYPIGRYIAGVLQRQREERLALGLCPRCGVPMKDELSRCPGCDKPVPIGRQIPSSV